MDEDLDGNRTIRSKKEIQQEFNEKKKLIANTEYVKKNYKNPIFLLDIRNEETVGEDW